MTTSQEAQAELIEKLSGGVIEAFKAGLIGREEAVEELKARGAELGFWKALQNRGARESPGLDPGAFSMRE